jgi:aspartokinase/homoserine dehydrogenase 1
MTKVMKFGGGCLKDVRSLGQAARIVGSESPRPAVVVSAISGVTDLLLGAVSEAKRDERSIPASVQSLHDIHVSLARRTIRDERRRNAVVQGIEARLKKVERFLHGVAYTGEITPAVRSRVLSYGERLSALVFASLLADRGAKSLPLESEEIGLITDHNLENATVDLQLFKRKFHPMARAWAKHGTIPVITGFFGCTSDGKTATFGRNGTDYSAAVIACGLRAKTLEIWKDVEGFMSADPKLVKRAAMIDRLSYNEAAELSYFGAKILHPRTLEPLAGMDISVRIKNLFDPKSPGTEISPEGYAKRDVIKSITSNRQIAMLRIRGRGVGFKPGIIGEIGHRLAADGVNIYSIITSQTCINLLVDRKDARRSYEALRQMAGGVIESVDLNEDVALIAAVGEGLLARKGLAARIFSAVSRAGVNVEMISTGASEVASYFIVDRDDTDKVIRALHREFF